MGKLDAFFAWAPAWMPWTMLLGCSFGATVCLAMLFAKSNSQTRKHRVAQKTAKKLDPSNLGTILYEGVFLQIVFAIGGLFALALAIVAVFKLSDYMDFWGAVKIVVVGLAVAAFLFMCFVIKDSRPPSGGGSGGGHH